MSHPSTREQKANPVRVSVESPGQLGVRDHYCTKGRAVVGLRVDGVSAKADVFCPLCGALAISDLVNHRYAGVRTPEGYAGCRCPHGFPDVACTDLARDYPEVAVALSGYAIREYVAAELAELHGCGPSLRDWVRPCPECREMYALRNLPRLRRELDLLADRLARDLRGVSAKRSSLAEAALELAAVRQSLERLRFPRSNPRFFERSGFVYLIDTGSAVKIGFSETHPDQSRLAELQIASPHELRLIGLIEGTMRDERRLQARFARHRIRGEWFRRAEEILAYFRETQSTG